jgi:phenylacetate-CoA ligase
MTGERSAGAYEATRQRHVAYMASRLPEHVERLGWPAERIRAERTERLRALLRIARERSAWHRTRLARVDVDRIDEDRLRDLPPMTKADLMSHFDDIVTDPRVTLAAANAHLAALQGDAYFLDDLHVVASGGSSGVRGVFVWGFEGWAESTLPNFRRAVHDQMTSADLDGPPTLMLVAAESATHFTGAAPQTFRSPTVTIHRFPVTRPLRDIVDGLNAADGTHLSAYASMLGTLAAEARAGRLRVRPKRVGSTAEPLLPEIRAAVREAWNAPVANMWGTSEGGINAIGCYRDDGMHVSDDLLIVEPVDAAGNPVPPGTPSAKVYLTNLVNPVQPLIRYEISDEVTFLDAPCACGSAHRRIADIQGRLDDAFAYAGGVVVHPHVFRSVLGREANVAEYQVRQTQRGADVALRATGPVDTGTLAARLRAALDRVGLRDADVSVEVVDELPRVGVGKLKRFVPRAS